MVLHVGVVQVYSACDLPDHAYTKIRLVIKNGGPGLHLLAKEKVGVTVGDCGKQVESVHSKSGESVEIFEACVERVLPFLQKNIRPRCSHRVERNGEQDECYMAGDCE
jgi:hypothetical protein